MRLRDWLDFFKLHKGKKIFHFNHLALLTGMKRHTLHMSLKRLVERKAIQRICRAFYANPLNPPTLEEISAEIYKPSYVSLESALYRHGILSQIPYTLTCVTTRLPRRFKTSFGMIEYRQVKRQYFFGFVRKNYYFVSEPEKALVDFLYLNRRKKIEGFVSELNLISLNDRKFKACARRLGVEVPSVRSR